jgi:hypothetical protein
MHIVQSAIPACRKALKGVDLKRLLAPPTWVCHRFFLISIAVTNIMSILLAYRSEKTKHEASPGQHLRPQTNPPSSTPAIVTTATIALTAATRETDIAIRRTTPHLCYPCIPILGTCTTSPPSALFRARPSPHRRRFSGRGYLPVFGTCRTILIDTPSQPLYTRTHVPLRTVAVSERRFPCVPNTRQGGAGGSSSAG